MTYSEAAAFVMPFGKHAGRTLDDIATSDAGLRYLDWLRGEREKPGPGPRGGLPDVVLSALVAYLDDPAIKSDLRALVGDD